MEEMLRSLKPNVIVVYAPMKVGSTSLVSSLRISLASEYSILHFHDENSLRIITGVNMKIIDLIKCLSKERKVYVMDVYRSPMERKMSCYFEWMSYHWNKKEEEISKIGIEKLMNRFNDLWPYLGESDYLKERYGLYVDDIPLNLFGDSKKYIDIKKEGIEYIKIRLKDSKEWGEILSKVIGKKIVSIKDYETSEKEWMKEVYREFKETYKIPLNYLEKLKKDESLKYYYSEEEVKEYINLWESKLSKEEHIPYTEAENDLYNKISVDNWNGKSLMKNHYRDEGCVCDLCSKKRSIIFSREVLGEETNERINHEEVVKECVERRVNGIKSVINRVKEIKRCNIKKIKVSSKIKMNVV